MTLQTGTLRHVMTKRNEVIQFRVSPTEKAVLEKLAAKSDLSVSDFIRKALMGESPASPVPFEAGDMLTIKSDGSGVITKPDVRTFTEQALAETDVPAIKEAERRMDLMAAAPKEVVKKLANALKASEGHPFKCTCKKCNEARGWRG